MGRLTHPAILQTCRLLLLQAVCNRWVVGESAHSHLFPEGPNCVPKLETSFENQKMYTALLILNRDGTNTRRNFLLISYTPWASSGECLGRPRETGVTPWFFGGCRLPSPAAFAGHFSALRAGSILVIWSFGLMMKTSSSHESRQPQGSPDCNCTVGHPRRPDSGHTITATTTASHRHRWVALFGGDRYDRDCHDLAHIIRWLAVSQVGMRA